MFPDVRRVLGLRGESRSGHRGRSLFGEAGDAAPRRFDATHPADDVGDGSETSLAVDLRSTEPVIDLGYGSGMPDDDAAPPTPVKPPQPNLRAPGEMWHPTVQGPRVEDPSTDFTRGYPTEDRVSWMDLRDEGADSSRPLSVGATDFASTRVAWDRLVDGTAPRARYGLGPAVDLYAASEDHLAEVEAENQRGRRTVREGLRRVSLFGSGAAASDGDRPDSGS